LAGDLQSSGFALVGWCCAGNKGPAGRLSSAGESPMGWRSKCCRSLQRPLRRVGVVTWLRLAGPYRLQMAVRSWAGRRVQGCR